MRIQHRNIPDSQLHEVRGAAAAAPETVLVADGMGASTFQKIKVSNLEGQITNPGPNLLITTDGQGGFNVGTVPYIKFNSSLSAITVLFNSGDFTVSANTFTPAFSGIYSYGLGGYTVAPEAQPVNVPRLIHNTDGSDISGNSAAGLVSLVAGQAYRMSLPGVCSLHRVSA